MTSLRAFSTAHPFNLEQNERDWNYVHLFTKRLSAVHN